MPSAYYNEIDPYAAEWLRNLMKAGLIAAGDVDERSIADVQPDDIKNYTQCHFFAGIGVWSYALRLAGWPDDRPIWTGSCPCQPFSGAGKRKGFADERHLWPVSFNLIRERRPGIILGEQVASPDGYAWFDDIQADMEGLDHACGAVVTPAAGYGAPEERHRIYWMANANDARSQGRRERRHGAGECAVGACSVVGGMGNAECVSAGRDARASAGPQDKSFMRSERDGPGSSGAVSGLDDSASARYERALEITEGEARHETRLRLSGEAGGPCRLAHADGGHTCAERKQRGRQHGQQPEDGCTCDGCARPGPVNGFWRAADWLFCRDGKWRPVEPGTFPLVDGASNRVGQLRAYGNAIVATQAAEFAQAVMDVIDA